MYCNLHSTYTFWYNIFLYIVLFFFQKSNITYTYLSFSVPIFIVGEYIMWYTKYYNKCNYSIYRALLSSVVSHWIPLCVFIIFHTTHNYKIDKMTLTFMLISVILFFTVYDFYKIYKIR